LAAELSTTSINLPAAHQSKSLPFPPPSQAQVFLVS
jgi:hypothetical protein